ncbi:MULTISPECIES: amino acid ABC transporter permease [Acidiphilium]|uniref:Amino acid ABC transporter membrane protein, PAAT family n=2 Tax=Acidiphilium TaxID=522 RepID=A5FXL6_ACICJ|nr:MULTISPECIES: amino acid ABC transporter permease [Acidiphilium]MBS3022404.1 amino acid ABC transporter permease [Acidiphilium multivorum]MBU6355856.1 amino acid ABC transporter permease [Rhodospirillales bacterium]ABQ30348.1 amino acid ABC transporter membrane protein, PAAT family [Acidiphilium cryptum JF-5]EGO94815.1 Polar amino acid ABC transporter, inner membrane subunit [Acidiphilium sp. PM]MDE2328590.1 amino acid ABC transporter permease [Rhodospirillales bacterium]
MHFDWPYFWHQLLEPNGAFLEGLWLTIMISVGGQAIGLAIGLPAALARRSKMGVLRWPARAYIFLMRGTPLLVQIVFIYTGLAAAGILRFHDIHLGGLTLAGNVQAGILALGLNEGAYMAEIFRAGIDAVDRGQTEAAKSLGMVPWQILRYVVLPQALRVVLLPIGNQFNIMLKNSTLVSVIGVSEMLLVTETINSATFRTFELYSVLALYFLALTTIWGAVMAQVERRMDRQPDDSAIDAISQPMTETA